MVGPAGPSLVLFLWAATEEAAEAGPDGGDLDGVDEGVEEAVAVDQDAGVQHEVAFASRAHVSQCACDGTRHQNACNNAILVNNYNKGHTKKTYVIIIRYAISLAGGYPVPDQDSTCLIHWMSAVRRSVC